MHRNAIRSAGSSKSSNGFRPAYNLFRRTRGRHLVCAVPEDYPVPGFIDGQGWAFAGKVGENSRRRLSASSGGPRKPWRL